MNNSERAARALDALDDYREDGRASLEEAITDFMADLRHLCGTEEIDYERCSRMAEMHFEEEG